MREFELCGMLNKMNWAHFFKAEELRFQNKVAEATFPGFLSMVVEVGKLKEISISYHSQVLPLIIMDHQCELEEKISKQY
jgi:hypothetical protein